MIKVTLVTQQLDSTDAMDIGIQLGKYGFTTYAWVTDALLASTEPLVNDHTDIFRALMVLAEIDDEGYLPTRIHIHWDDNQLTIQEHEVFTTYQYVPYKDLDTQVLTNGPIPPGTGMKYVTNEHLQYILTKYNLPMEPTEDPRVWRMRAIMAIRGVYREVVDNPSGGWNILLEGYN